MNNQKKAIEISDGYDYTFDKRERDASYYSALEMAEWKDQQFKEYLEKKKNSIPTSEMELYDKVVCTEFIDEIINELFKEDKK